MDCSPDTPSVTNRFLPILREFQRLGEDVEAIISYGPLPEGTAGKISVTACAREEPRTLGPRWSQAKGNWLQSTAYDVVQQLSRYCFFPANSYDLYFAMKKAIRLREHRPQLIYAMSVGVSNSLPALTRSAGSIPTLFDLDDYIIRESNPLLRLFTGVTVASEGLRRRFRHLDPFYLPNCGDLDLFGAVQPRREESIPREIIWHGVMYPDLIESFIQFCSGLKMTGGDFSFTALGKGSPRVLEQMKSTSIGRKSATVEEWVPRELLPQRLSRASIGVVLPLSNRLYESLRSPGKLLDYMALGIPVICANYGEACRTVVRSECGIPVDFAKPKEVADAVTTLLGDSTLRQKMGTNGRNFLLKTQNLKTVVPHLLKYVSDKWNSKL